MTPYMLLAELRKRGVQLSVHGNKLRYKGAKSALTFSLMQELVRNKQELISLLQLRLGGDVPEPPLVRSPRSSGEYPPLSPGQQSLWFIDQLSPGNPAYNVPLALRICGHLDVEALAAGLRGVILRHEALRASFAMTGEGPIQMIAETAQLGLKMVDFSGMVNEPSTVQSLLDTEARKPFSLTTGPLYRAKLFYLAPEEYILMCTMHHIVCDRWSIDIFVNELAEFYRARISNESAALAPLTIQYGDYCVWCTERLSSGALAHQMQYWRRQLGGAPDILELPTDSLRPPVQTYDGAREFFALPSELCLKLNEIADRLDVSKFMFLLAGFKAMLFRYSGQKDIVLGCPVSGRTQSELERLIGYFLNTLVLRTDLSGDPSFVELLIRVREVTLEAYAHQDIPFESIVAELRPERDPSFTPFFQVMFVFQNYRRSSVRLSDIEIEPVTVEAGTAMLDLTLSISENADSQFSGFFRYNTDLFRQGTIKQMIANFAALLEGAVRDPDAPISRLPMLNRDIEKWKSRVATNVPRNFIEFPATYIHNAIGERFREQVLQTPNNVALKAAERIWTYQKLDFEANRIARMISRWQRRVGHGDKQQRIGILLEHGPIAIIAMLGINKSGNAYVPLDPEYPIRRLSHIVADAAIGLLLTNTANLEKAWTFQSGGLEIVNLDEPAPIEPCEAEWRPIKGQDIVCLLYTSGSTGEPKGVVQTAQHILHVVRNYTNKICLASTDRVLVVGSLSHVAAMTDIWAGLLNGAVLCPFDVRTQGVEALVGWLCSEQITVYHSVPTLYRLLIDALPSRASFVRAVVLGGEEVWKQDIDRFRGCFASDSIFVNMYGSTESTVSTMFIVDQDMQVGVDRVPVGYPVGENEILLLDETGRQALVSGEITVRSPFIPEGYWQKPDASAAAFSRGAAGIVYRTGDQGRFLADGSLLVLGRKDTQVKVRGFRVETGEVETALKRHPNVKEAAVKAWPDANGGKRLGALIVPNSADEPPTVRSITTFLRPVLPAYMVPEAFRFMEALPRTPNGKIDFRMLPEPNWCEPHSSAAPAPPRTDTETVVANLWKEVLRIERVSIHDRFFDLGGHSLNAVQLIARLRKTFQMELPLNDLFAAPTIAGIAEIIEHIRERPEQAGRLTIAPTRLRRRATNALTQSID